MEISVRAATVEDAAAIAAINIASWESAYRGIVNDTFLDRATLAERAAGWRGRITAAGWSTLVAEAPHTEAARAVTATDPASSAVVRSNVVGYTALALASRDPDAEAHTAEIAAIYVSPASFRGGAGSALLAAAFDLFANRGLSEATLWVLTANTRARAFYARHGFLADGSSKWLTFLGAEEMRLRREL